MYLRCKHNLVKVLVVVLMFGFVFKARATNVGKNPAIISLETGLTITKVRVAQNKKQSYVIGSSYEGTIVAVTYSGEILWKNKLSGFMNHDVWCADLTGDGIDEIVTANADGSIYCLNSKGEKLWAFKKNTAPMYAVCILKTNNKSYVVAGSFDKSIYYLSPKGDLIKEIKSSTYSIEKPWSKYKKDIPESNVCVSNFIRPVKQSDGTEILAVLGTNNHMNVVGTLYFFNVMDNLPFKVQPIKGTAKEKAKLRIRPIGDLKAIDVDDDGNEDIVMGASAHANDLLVSTYNLKLDKFNFRKLDKIRFGYDIIHSEIIKENGKNRYLSRAGSQIHLYEPNTPSKQVERLVGKYAFNDLRKDGDKIILASAQSGGSCIHVIDTSNKDWKKDFIALRPKGKIQTIINNTKVIREDLKKYNKPSYIKKSEPVYLMTEKVPSNLEGLKQKLTTKYKNPVFLNSLFLPKVENWDRTVLSNEKYRKARDRRKKYVLSQDESLQLITNAYNNEPGVSYWAGHGNDPYMFNIETTKKVINKAEGKKTVLIYPEVEDHNPDNLNFLVKDLIYPLAKHAQDKNTNIFLRSKNVFWLGSNYLGAWSRLMSGEFADVFVPSMEETTDKTMELSLAGRMGMWTSGAVNGWGTRAVPDNTAYDRSRQLGYQRLPNHFLRMLIFHTANGAQFINNFAVDQDYLSIYWELIAKGVLYVPKRNEILSISPVHLSMKEPDHHFLNDGANVKWNVFYNEEYEKNNHFVLSRMNGSWPGAPVTQWDFSRYAAGVKERRLNFLAPYENGLVLITPPQTGVFAQKEAVRGQLKDNLHPLYKEIMKEYITDGHHYYSHDGKQTFKAEEYYKIIENDIKDHAKKLPITVSGDVAWVVAQTSPTHLRLTIIDNGYINPEESTAQVCLNTISPIKIKDVLNGEVFKISESKVSINVPLGGFRFIDIELKEKI